MSKGKKVIPDYIPAGIAENVSEDPTDEFNSAVDNGRDFTASTTASDQGKADLNEQTGNSSPAY